MSIEHNPEVARGGGMSEAPLPLRGEVQAETDGEEASERVGTFVYFSSGKTVIQWSTGGDETLPRGLSVFESFEDARRGMTGATDLSLTIIDGPYGEDVDRD